MGEPPISHSLLAKCRVLVVGDVMLDRYWYGDVARISPEAPVPVVHIEREEDRLGGAANVALNIKTLGAQVTLLSMLGKDDAARCLRRLLEQSGIQAELSEDTSMETVVNLRVSGRKQQIIRIDFERAPAHEMLSNMLLRYSELIADHDVLLFSDYGKGGLTHVSKMIQQAVVEHKPVLIDPKGADWSRYSGATVVTSNSAELTKVFGSWQEEAGLSSKVEELLKNLQIKGLLLTDSEDGMTLYEAGRVTSIPAKTLEVADVTGAGDTVIATLAVMMAYGLDLQHALAWASKAGALVVAKLGAASLTCDELLA